MESKADEPRGGIATIGLIETVRVRGGEAPLWPLHRRRLEASCQALGIPVPPNLAPPSGGEDRIVRLAADRCGVQVTERPAGPTTPLRLITSPIVHQRYPHKTTERDQFERTLTAARERGAEDGILLTADRWVAEAAIWTILWWERDQLCGPELELGILPSIARARLAEIVGGIAERRRGVDELHGQSILLANAGRGVVAVHSWDGVRVPADPRTDRLKHSFWP